jgi:hypothetical protein
MLLRNHGTTRNARGGKSALRGTLWAVGSAAPGERLDQRGYAPWLSGCFSPIPTIERGKSGARRKRTRRIGEHSAALCRRTSPLAPVLGRTHLCVCGQLDTRDYRVQFLFPILRVWAHPSSTLPVSYTVEEAKRHMSISERSPPRVKSSSRNPLVLLCRT